VETKEQKGGGCRVSRPGGNYGKISQSHLSEKSESSKGGTARGERTAEKVRTGEFGVRLGDGCRP